MMLEQIIVGIIVLAAALYVLMKLRRAATGPTACEFDTCADCPFGGGCEHRRAETAHSAATPAPDETRSPE